MVVIMKKKLQALLLLFSLTVHQTTEPFSWQWCSDLYTRATQTITNYLSGVDRELKGVGFTLSVVGLIGGIYYLRNYFGNQNSNVYLRKKYTPTLLPKGIAEQATYENSLNGQELEIKQLKVALQIGALCGYYAILNSYGIATDYFGTSDDWLKDDGEIIETLFGTKGLWRKQVIAKEIKADLKTTVKEQFDYKGVSEDIAEVEFKGDTLYIALNPIKIRSKYQILLPEFIAHVIQHPGIYSKIDNDTFKSAFGKFIANNKTINIDDENDYLILPSSDSTKEDAQAILWDHLSKEEVINKYITLNTELSLEKNDDGVLLKLKDKKVNVKKKSGEWIGNDHIAFLCRKLNRELGEKELPVIVIASLENLELISADMNDFVRLAKRQKKYIQAFIVGDMSQRLQSDGHWISVVFDKNKERHTYTVMDSLSKYGIDSSLVQKFVGHVETKFHTLKEDS